jgi:C-3',4' desaturase CrtD
LFLNFQNILKVVNHQEMTMFDVAIVGAGIAGMATALRLQAGGLRTITFEAHGQPGGCAGFFRRKGFAFDVGATTLVDFEAGGVGGELLESVGMPTLESEILPGYIAWLPDRTVTLYRDPLRWSQERLSALGNTVAHRSLWALLDQLANVFWTASRGGIKLPLQTLRDVVAGARAVGWRHLPLARHLQSTMGDALRTYQLRDDKPLVGLLSMLVEDTVHSTLDDAPLINAALGITIRGAVLSRHRGGMFGFWKRLVDHYRSLGGELRVGCRVKGIDGHKGRYTLMTQRGQFEADQMICAIPADLTARIAPAPVAQRLRPYLRRDENQLGGAVVVFLGVPDWQVADQPFTHHQLLQDYDHPLGNGNNMFISVSAPGDTDSAPPGYRSVMISTHCELDAWQNLSADAYAAKKQAIGNRLVHYARRVYPHLGEGVVIYEIGTPRTYERYTHRALGAVGGVRQTLRNTNQNALPHDGGLAGFWLVGDSTWPGLGTVACVLGSRIVAEHVRRAARIGSAHPLAARFHWRGVQ